MFGYLCTTLLSATFFMLSSALIRVTPRCFGLLPATGLFFLIPPVPTRILITTMPCFALYPSLLALCIDRGGPGVWALCSGGGNVYAGGDFTAVHGVNQQRLAIFRHV